MNRTQTTAIVRDLSKKIVFLIGPRQVGKTWLTREIGKQFERTVYLNYDHAPDREVIREEAWLDTTELLIFDELHKMPDWKNYLKGVYDTKPALLKIIVTGSARLDFQRQSGDSLAGRFFTHRLLPLSIKELSATGYRDGLDRLIDRGGFPEPFLSETDVDANRWRQQYVDGLISTDIHTLNAIHDLRAMQLVLAMLQNRVGSPVSFTSIARDIGVSSTTVLKYIQVLESLYIVFRVTPYTNNIARSLLKEPKIYFFDTAMVKGDPGARLENCIAVSLLKHVCGLTDYQGESWSLNYLRTKDGREVDFCLVHDNRVIQAIEVKTVERRVSDNLRYFSERYDFKGIQCVKTLLQEHKENGIELRNAARFLEELFL
ncbi:MAG: ATP-binding protein [Chitinispirillaceae bacterium]|nr:ATP-binding protein [Chitinispirillaceae bacterium]